ncbi:MAG: DUF2017 family protein [Verrucomicrobiota bacterium]
MRAQYLNDSLIEITGIGFLECQILWRLAAAADPHDSSAAQERISSRPTENSHPHIDADWHEHVRPELLHLFASAVEIVRADLINSSTSPHANSTVRIPILHVKPWLIALNQARLTLAARFSIGEEHANHPAPEDLSPTTIAQLFIEFFGVLQQVLLKMTED